MHTELMSHLKEGLDADAKARRGGGGDRRWREELEWAAAEQIPQFGGTGGMGGSSPRTAAAAPPRHRRSGATRRRCSCRPTRPRPSPRSGEQHGADGREKKLLKEMAKALEGVSDDEDDEEDAAEKLRRRRRRRASSGGGRRRVAGVEDWERTDDGPRRERAAAQALAQGAVLRLLFVHNLRTRYVNAAMTADEVAHLLESLVTRARVAAAAAAAGRAVDRHRHVAQLGPVAARRREEPRVVLRQDVCEEEGRGGRREERQPRAGERRSARRRGSSAREGAPRAPRPRRHRRAADGPRVALPAVLEAAPLARRRARAVGARGAQDDGRRLDARDAALARRPRAQPARDAAARAEADAAAEGGDPRPQGERAEHRQPALARRRLPRRREDRAAQAKGELEIGARASVVEGAHRDRLVPGSLAVDALQKALELDASQMQGRRASPPR